VDLDNCELISPSKQWAAVVNASTATLKRSLYPDASFDFAISEYGACLWADPQRWVPEAARLLRPGGQLVFLTNSLLMTLCMPPEEGVAATERLLCPAFGLNKLIAAFT
jgi:SAM-dependent methyltransferase